jgi:hypothetical protein
LITNDTTAPNIVHFERLHIRTRERIRAPISKRDAFEHIGLRDCPKTIRRKRPRDPRKAGGKARITHWNADGTRNRLGEQRARSHEMTNTNTVIQ